MCPPTSGAAVMHELARTPTTAPLRAGDGGRVACDSLVALGNATADGAVLFAKNSDRPADECQPLVLFPRKKHPAGARLRCQYIEISQAPETARLIGSQPFWLWGLEHGLNEHGVVIGNHTVFSHDQPAATGLTGMDLVRLGLERGSTAAQAVAVITGLIERHGQGGSGFLDMDWPYHNSFLIADRHEAYLLETSSSHWALRRIDALGSASNHLTIGQDWDFLSTNALQHAVESGWWPRDNPNRFDFAAAYRDTSLIPEVISSGRYRRTRELLEQNKGRLTAAHFMSVLRDHYGGLMHEAGIGPENERCFSLCMHADPVGTTTASMVTRLPPREEEPLCYWASLGSPCVSVFLPCYIDAELPALLGRGGREPADDSSWWGFRRLLSLVDRDPGRHAARVRAFWDEFERTLTAAGAAVEIEAVQLRQSGNGPAATLLLGTFMNTEVERMMESLATITRELSAG